MTDMGKQRNKMKGMMTGKWHRQKTFLAWNMAEAGLVLRKDEEVNEEVRGWKVDAREQGKWCGGDGRVDNSQFIMKSKVNPLENNVLIQ